MFLLFLIDLTCNNTIWNQSVNPYNVSPGEVLFWNFRTETRGHSAKGSGSSPDPLQTAPNRVPVEMARMTPVSMLGGISHHLAKGKRLAYSIKDLLNNNSIEAAIFQVGNILETVVCAKMYKHM
jgi:hypothetical protein